LTRNTGPMAATGRLLPRSLVLLSTHIGISFGERGYGTGPDSLVRASDRCNDPYCPLLTSAYPSDGLSVVLAQGR